MLAELNWLIAHEYIYLQPYLLCVCPHGIGIPLLYFSSQLSLNNRPQEVQVWYMYVKLETVALRYNFNMCVL